MMKKWMQMLGLAGMAFLFCFTGVLVAQAEQSLSFGEVVDGVNLRKNTKFAVKEYTRTAVGTEVQWQGKVVDVVGGRGKAKVLVANKDRQRHKGYNIVLVVISEIERAATLKKGEQITFTGVIHKIKPFKRGGGAIVTVNEVEFLN